MIYSLEIEESSYGEEIWLGGGGAGMLEVGGEWSAGGYRESDPKKWAELKAQAVLFANAHNVLAALEGMLRVFDNGQDSDYSPAIVAARAAAAAARKELP